MVLSGPPTSSNATDASHARDDKGSQNCTSNLPLTAKNLAAHNASMAQTPIEGGRGSESVLAAAKRLGFDTIISPELEAVGKPPLTRWWDN